MMRDNIRQSMREEECNNAKESMQKNEKMKRNEKNT